MVYSSRSRSRSVSTVPLTRATALPVSWGPATTPGGADAAGEACELSNWPQPVLTIGSSRTAVSRAAIASERFIFFLQKIGEGRPSPALNKLLIGHNAF